MAGPEEWTEDALSQDDQVVVRQCEGCACLHYGVIRWLNPDLYAEAAEQARAQRAKRRQTRLELLRLGNQVRRASPASSAAAGALTSAVGASPATPSGKTVGNGPEPAAPF